MHTVTAWEDSPLSQQIYELWLIYDLFIKCYINMCYLLHWEWRLISDEIHNLKATGGHERCSLDIFVAFLAVIYCSKMDISYSLFFVTLMVIFYVPGLCGTSKYGKDWVDPDPLSKINRDRTSEPVAKVARFVIHVSRIMSVNAWCCCKKF